MVSKHHSRVLVILECNEDVTSVARRKEKCFGIFAHQKIRWTSKTSANFSNLWHHPLGISASLPKFRSFSRHHRKFPSPSAWAAIFWHRLGCQRKTGAAQLSPAAAPKNESFWWDCDTMLPYTMLPWNLLVRHYHHWFPSRPVISKKRRKHPQVN